MLFNKKDFDSKQRFSIRKLSVGVCSVLLSTLFLTFNEGQTVHASTDANTTDAATTNVVSNTNNSTDNNDNKKDDSKVEASSLATAEKHAPIPIAAGVKSTKSETPVSSVVAEVNNQENSSKQTQDQTTSVAKAVSTQKDTSMVNTADKTNTKDTSVQNNVEEDKTNSSLKQTPVSAKVSQSNNNSDTQEKQNIKPVTPKADSTENVAPIPYTLDGTEPPYVIAGTNLTDLASKFISNADVLAENGATFSWVGDVPTPTQEDASAGSTISGTIKVTYADGTSVEVPIESMVEPQSQLQPNTFYYVNKVGDTPDFNTADANGNDLSTILYNQNVGNPSAFSYKVVGTVDTSEIGIHWINAQVTDNNTFNGMPGGTKVIGGPYIVQIPYVVQGLKLRDDIPVDASGNPIINAQLATMPQSTTATPTTPELAFDPTSNSFQGLWGQYFYQDYALAYALGITASASNWTAPTDLVNTKTNHFTMTFSKMPNATQQEVAVNYIASPKAREVYIYNAANRNYMTANGLNKTEIRKLFTEGYLNDKVWVTLADGTKVYASKLSFIDNGQRFIVTNTRSGKYNINFNASFDQTSSNDQPLIFSNNNFDAASTEFNSELNKWYQKTNNTNVANYTAGTPATWESVSTTGISLAPSMKAKEDPYVQELTNGPFTFDNDALEELVRNPINPTEVHNMLPTWPTNMQPNTILGDNKTWPEGTKANWLGNDGSTKLTFDKAGEKKTGDVTITLPSGSSYTVKDITVISKANVMVKNETVDYGTTLTAADLVSNKNVFPEGTTYQFVNNSEPNWEKADAYNNVQITATYPGPDGKPVTTPVATCAVAINDARSITVLAGSDVPSVDSILNLPSTWKEYTASWTTPINTNSTNQGVITIHYPAGDLDQTIKVYVSVIPKQTAVDGQNFFTNGNLYNGQTGSIANGTTTSTVLTSNGTKEVSYSAYNKSGNPGQQTTFTQGTDSYQPNYIISGLQTNADGLVSGPQTATIRVTVPNGTLGTEYDADGKYYYYELNANVNVAQKVTFEFVDQYNNNAVVGQTYSQEFIPGVQTNLNFNMTIPTDPEGYGYELANGTSIPRQYTLSAFTQTPVVVQVPIHQKMHFNITFHDEDSNTDLGTVDISGGLAGNGGNDPNVVSNLTFPAGANSGNYYSVSTSGVPTGVTLAGSYWTPLTDPNAIWTVPNYRWDKTEAVEKALTGATMTINLKHKITTTQEQETRTATVNYVKAQVNADGTYTQDGSAAQSAVLDVYYSRNQYQDQVTKNKTYSPWLWDTTRGQNGYHVVSGNWTSLPTSWGAVVADVPTVDGYTAAAITDKSGKPANQFVYPTWNTAGADGNTDPAQASQAYTKNATAYEAQPVHTVLYIPVQTQARLVTAKFIISGGNKDGQDFAPASQVQIFYNRTGSLNVNNNTITYGNWQWDNTAGNSTTPGFKVLSGSWSLPTKSTQSWSVNAPSAGSDYVIANINSAGSYTTVTFGAPGYNSNTTFTNSTANQWFMRNELITYYVPKSLVNKTVTRTIVITEPGEATRTFSTETVVLNRQVKVNNDDTGVVFAGFAGSGWNTGTWAAQTVPTHEGYTMSATQTVNGVTTPLTLVNGQVPAETVTDTTQNTTINITWGAVATATLTGNGESTYNGQAITNGELNNGIHVTITGPTASSGAYTLQNGDVEFSTDGTTWSTNMPINAGKYQVRLTTQGETGIKNQFGNNSIVWTSDGKSTITSNATYTINKLDSAATMANAQAGNYEMTYNGAAPSAIDPSKFQFTAIVNGQSIVLDATGLTSNDFDWADGAAPVNVGTYQVILNNAGLAQLQQNNPNFTLTNAGNGTFTINQANASATLSGNGTRPYNGNAVSVDDLNVSNDNNNITLTLHYPKDGNADYSTTVKLNANDFTWNTPNGQAPVNASSQAYIISINPAAVQKIIEDAVGTGQNGVSNVKFANGAIVGNASYTITPLNTDATLSNISESNYTKVYDAEATNQIDPAKFQITVMVDGKKVTLDTQSFTGNSYEWVDANGNALTENPKNVGTYYVKLTDAAFNVLQVQNPNFTLTNTGLGVYTITPAEATGTLSGSNSKVYDGQAINNAQLNSNAAIKVSLNFPGANGQTYTLKQGDYTISGNATDVGSYTITLTQAGITNVENYIRSLAGSGQSDQSNVQFANNAISGQASFEITPSANVISVSGTQNETYNGSAINVVYNASGNNSVVVSIAKAAGNATGALASLTNVTLDSGDFTIVNGPAVNAGSYEVQLTADGLAKVQQALGKNYSISLGNSTGKLVVNKYKASAKFSGDPEYTYTGVAVSPDNYLSQYSIKLNEPNNPIYKLVAGDIEFNVNGNWTTEAPVNVGQYQVRLSQQGWNNIKAINSANVEWSATASAGTGTYTINQAKATATLSGSNSMIYNGSAVTTAELYANGSTINVSINGTGIANLPTTFTLSDGDYTWSTEDGKAPVNVGNYTIKLTEAGINNIQTQINQAVGQGNVALTTTADKAGTANFEIKQAVASNVQLYGDEQSTYNGQAVGFDPTNSATARNFGFHNVENLTLPTLSTSDFTWYDAKGNVISAPTNAGTYHLKLNAAGEQAFADANPNYTFEDNGKSTISGQITYVINPAELVISVAGSASKVFDDKNAVITQEQINNGDIKLVWGNSDSEPIGLGKFNLTPDDLEVVDAQGNPALHANAGYGVNGQPIKGAPYIVRLTASGLEKIKQLTGASNYTISQSANNGEYFIYEHKAELTLTGNQTTIYGTVMPFDPSAYKLDFTNWLNTDKPIPNLTWKDGKLLNNGDDTGLTWTAGDLYVEGYPNGGVPTNVGTYRVKISKQLTDKLRQLFPDYDFSGNVDQTLFASGTTDTNSDIIDPSHTPASYVITPAVTTVTINGAEHVKYGENTAINYGGNNGYSISITAPVHNDSVDNDAELIYTNVTLGNGDLEFVSEPGNVGTYQVKLSAQGLKKLQDLTGASNYDWTQAASARANFYVDQMPVTIAVSGQSSVTYGSPEWLDVISENPSGYTLTVTTENGTILSYDAVDGDLVFNQTPGNVGTYQVELSTQGLTNIEKALGTNYSYPQGATDVITKGTLTVNQGEATVTLNGSDGKVYNAGQTVPNDLELSKYNVTYSATVYSADGTAQTLALTANDLQIVGNAVNVGTYQVELAPTGQAKLEQLTGNNGTNYKWTFDSNANYKITAATATAELNGSNEKTFDGSAVTTAEINSNGQILVHFTFPGSNAQSTYTLQDGDYTWNTSDGEAPAIVGNYTISLNKQAILDHLQVALNQEAGLGENYQPNVTVSTDDISGEANFTINPQVISNVIVSSTDQTKVYDGNPASLDVSDLSVMANGTVANTPLVNPGLTPADFTWYDAAGNELTSAPINVGTYEARLKASTLAKLQKANSNYKFSSVTGTINYTIVPAPATATISGSASRNYNAQTTSVSEVMNEIKWSQTGLVNGQNLNLGGLTANSYAWYTKNADGNYIAMTGSPVNAGTYYLQLTDSAVAQVKTDNPNYSFTVIDGEFTYTINAVTGSATLSGSASKTYDGQAVTTAEVDSTNGDIIVNFTFPGSNAQSIYTLQAGDYIWESQDGQTIAAPVNVGTYTIKLSNSGIANLQSAIDQYAGQGNVILDEQGLLGSATYTINPKALNVTLEGNRTGTDGKTYDGQPAIINTQDANFGVFTTNGLVDGEVLNTENITDSDYEWVDVDGKTISAPTNAGTYYIALTTNGLKQLQLDNPNYRISESGQFVYVISPAEEQITISGSQESTTASIDSSNFKVDVPIGITVPTGMNYEFVSGIPDESGVYAISLTPESIANLENANPNYKLDISSNAKFTLDAILSIKFEDTQDGNKQVGKTITKIGVAGSTIEDLDLAVPENYELAPDQILPTSYTFTKALSQNLYIKLIHKTSDINPVDPNTNPDPTNKNWFKENGLVKDVTRTINYEGLNEGQLAQIPESQKVQTVEFTRTAKYDLITGKIVANSEGPWTAVDGKDAFAGFTPFTFAGYTAAPAKVEQVKVTGNDKNSKITITYTANNQTGKISYVDSDGKEIGQTALSGKTDQSVAVNPEAPAGWRIVTGQDIPKSVTATATGIPTVVVKVEHSTITVTPKTPEADIPTGPVPGDPNKNYEKMESLTASPTRTIVVTDPSGKITKVVQTVNFTRTATFDEVTGEITYSDWTSSEPTEWSEYNAPQVSGYTATASVSVKAVTAETKDETVNISYTANNQTGKISYVDSNGKEIGQTALAGKTDQSVAVNLEAPAGWRIVTGQDIPKTITATANGIPTVTVKVEHSTITVTPKTPEADIPTGPVPGNPSEDYEKMESLTAAPTRTIVVTDPSGKTTKVTQTVNFTRTATFDEVTGEITYSDWTNSEPAEWSEYNAPQVAGYTTTASVSVKAVTAETKDETVNISYTANNQTGKISYVDSDGKEIGQTTISGKTGETINVNPQVPAGWRIVPGQDIPKTVIIGENGGPTVTVKVEHGTIIVTPQTSEKDVPTGPVPGDPNKNYEKMSSLTASPTRTIVVTDPSGKTTKVTQTVNFTRTATFDEVTGKITYSDWQIENSTAANHTAQWDSYTPQFITHYVPSIAEVPAEEVNANTSDSQVTINYSPASESQVIRYVDKTGKEIGTQIVPGKYGVDTTFTPKLPNNWQSIGTLPTSVKIGENGGSTTVIVEAKTEPVQQTKTVTETIHYQTADGKQIVADKEMEVNFTRTGVKNLVTGEITWNSWNNAEEIFNEVPSPVVSGYTASPAKVTAQTVTPNSENLVFTVTYTKDQQTHPIIPDNKPNKPQKENVPKHEQKTQDELIHEYGYHKKNDGRLVDHTGHVYPAGSKVKENGAIYSEKGELLSVGSRRKNELPQTGLHDNSLIAAIGSLLAGISIFGLLGGRKKKDDDK